MDGLDDLSGLSNFYDSMVIPFSVLRCFSCSIQTHTHTKPAGSSSRSLAQRMRLRLSGVFMFIITESWKENSLCVVFAWAIGILGKDSYAIALWSSDSNLTAYEMCLIHSYCKEKKTIISTELWLHHFYPAERTICKVYLTYIQWVPRSVDYS